jgi:hypothetical protein
MPIGFSSPATCSANFCIMSPHFFVRKNKKAAPRSGWQIVRPNFSLRPSQIRAQADNNSQVDKPRVRSWFASAI